MAKRLLAVLIASSLLLSGCSSMLARDYASVTAHNMAQTAEGDPSVLRADSYQELVNALLSAKGLSPDAAAVDWETYQEEQYDKLAAGVRASLDMDRVYRILNGEE